MNIYSTKFIIIIVFLRLENCVFVFNWKINRIFSYFNFSINLKKLKNKQIFCEWKIRRLAIPKLKNIFSLLCIDFFKFKNTINCWWKGKCVLIVICLFLEYDFNLVLIQLFSCHKFSRVSKFLPSWKFQTDKILKSKSDT